MRINCVFSSTYSIDPGVDIDELKSVGSTWGSWKSWRSCSTDNVICHDYGKAKELLTRNFQFGCNFYLPREHFVNLGRPPNVKLYDGEFRQEVVEIEDIIALNLVSKSSDIILLFGFDLSAHPPVADRFEQHRVQNRLGLLRSAIVSDPGVQWVLVDHPKKIDKAYAEITNLACDVMKNVLQLLK